MRRLFFFCFCLIAFLSYAQDEDIVAIIDDLTIKWDKQAESLEKYSGMKYYCTSEQYRDKTINLLDKIHHYDTLLYNIVTEKYKDVKDKEAQATIKDILTVETDYTTPSFKAFLKDECVRFAEIEEKYDKSSGSPYFKEVEKLEKELSKYVINVTKRIDLIDEHIHHLKLD
ncbi:hypothetical protein [Ekhidna sp.]|uniref:hypothetical protein n=1 Tax=Ekhidna sp. TaxID=2608089 RepID=UPI00329811F1